MNKNSKSFIRQMPLKAACLFLAMCLSIPLSSFAATPAGGKSPASSAPAGKAAAQSQKANLEELYVDIDEDWHGLLDRLNEDKLFAQDVLYWFSNIQAPYSPRPMGTKVSSLFKNKYMRKPKPASAKPAKPGKRLYPGKVTQANIQKCNEFLKKNKAIFDKTERDFNVPKDVVVSLMFVETHLGTFIGSKPAFWSLACMASADTPERIKDHLAPLPMTKERAEWVNDLLIKRSDWAYKELKALIEYSREHNQDPLAITGSIYGAIGLCQFMPSNISHYAVDGDGDGIIDLFTLEDAVPSIANYLKVHGWDGKMTEDKKVKVLKRYNNSTAYANTILALADGVKKHDKPVKAKPKKKAAAKKAAAKPAAKKQTSTAAKNTAKK